MIDLKTVLNSKNLSQLKFACQLLNLSLQGKIRKADIVDALFDTLCKKETLDFIFTFLSDEEIRNFKLACAKDMFNNAYDESYLEVFDVLGYINIKNDIFISDIMYNYINASHEELNVKRQRTQLIHKYLTCFANLYGIVPADKIIDLFNRYERKKLQKSELQDYQKITHIKRLPYTVIADYYLINNEVFLLDENNEYFTELVLSQRGKKYAVLPKNELFKYIDPDYFEKTPQYRKMKTMLTIELELNQTDAEELADDFANMCVAGMEFDFIFQYLEEKNIAFKDMEQCNKFVKAYTDMHNNTRMWENCGNTPNEMRKQMK